MIEDDFDILAPKVLAGEANPQERARLEQLLAHDAGLRAEFAQLRAVWTTLNDTAPLIAAIIWLGVYPAPVLRRMEGSAQLLVNRVEQRSVTQVGEMGQ